MTEKELIGRIQELGQMKPSKNWVVSTKREISFSFLKPALVGVFVLLIAVFVSAQTALPGEKLYTLKRIVEKSQAFFVSEKEKPKLELELANKRLEELRQIAQSNDVRKLAPAMKEVKESTAEVAKSLKKVRKADSEIVAQTKKLEENKEITQQILGTKIETEELEDAYKIFAEREIKNLEKSSLTKKQEEVLEEAKEYFEKSDYYSAFIKSIETSWIK
ncbi:hypothetical protein AMJ49_00960 [Parcubacteria bacterium DG_74_2]|nr:MAG: hypothetical protein AMJ49_00960 [Parcubacteria bacterium DG_74_2]